MIPVKEIISEIQKFRPNANADIIEKAYALGKVAHQHQKRKSGEPYFAHPTQVAFILASHQMDEDTVATGLLHDVVEDTDTSIEDIEQQFGQDIADMVDGVTKLSKISFQSKDIQQSESFRKMLLAMAKDIRVIVVKLADRLHNMRTLEHMREDKQRIISQETLDIYAPLAHRLGMSWLKNELEDLSFQYLHPSSYAMIQDHLSESRNKHDKFISSIIDVLARKMKEENIPCEITGRLKHAFSIFKKMEKRRLEFDQIHDLLAFRILVDSIPKCYEALGHIHAMWKPIPGRFKDFIALPKANMYQSLHTTLIGPNGERIEVQIRTHDMHSIAEDGIAAHWQYKTNKKASAKAKDIQQFAWLRQMVEWQQDLSDAHQFIESVKIDLFSDEVYVFTPQGEVLDFPRGSTPIDYAFRVHTEVGLKCKGAIVNGKMVPLKYQLKNGDKIEIITDKNMRPSKDWLKLVKTSKARSKIRSHIKKIERDQAKKMGHEILIREFRKHKERFESVLDSDLFSATLKELRLGNEDELLLAVGYGKIHPQVVVEKYTQLLNPEKTFKKLAKVHENVSSQAINHETSAPIQVGGEDSIVVRYGKCCTPLPGDAIIGFITRGRGVTIHKSDCYMILETDDERKIHVAWADSIAGSKRIVRIRVITTDTVGILADVSQQISKSGGNISHASIKTTADNKAICYFDVSIQNTNQLNALLQSIGELKGVLTVERVKNL